MIIVHYNYEVRCVRSFLLNYNYCVIVLKYMRYYASSNLADDTDKIG